VERQNASWAHAEMVALALAQQTLGTYDLRSEGAPRCALVTSAEPCAMCLGAVPWSGVQQLVCGARDEDVRAIGFDEGHKPADWVAALEHRGIVVLRDVLRDEAAAALRAYAAQGGAIYNPGNDAP
ncbi:MAG: deaminase, partial [Anaerolineae bacterium]